MNSTTINKENDSPILTTTPKSHVDDLRHSRTPTSESIKLLSTSDDNLKIPSGLFSNSNTPMKLTDQEYNDEDLEHFAKSLEERVTFLIHSNEEELENLLLSTQNLVELGIHDDDVNEEGFLIDTSFSNEDGIEVELGRLADAERLLRDELVEVNDKGFDFMRYADDDSESSEESESADGCLDASANKGGEEEEGVEVCVKNGAPSPTNVVDGIYDSQREKGLDREQSKTSTKDILSDDCVTAANSHADMRATTMKPQNADAKIDRVELAKPTINHFSRLMLNAMIEIITLPETISMMMFDENQVQY